MKGGSQQDILHRLSGLHIWNTEESFCVYVQKCNRVNAPKEQPEPKVAGSLFISFLYEPAFLVFSTWFYG